MIANNVLSGRVHTTASRFRQLQSHRNRLRTLSGLTGSMARKRSLLSRQRGGTFPALIPLFAAIAAGAAYVAPVAATVGAVASTAAGIKSLVS